MANAKFRVVDEIYIFVVDIFFLFRVVQCLKYLFFKLSHFEIQILKFQTILETDKSYTKVVVFDNIKNFIVIFFNLDHLLVKNFNTSSVSK